MHYNIDMKCGTLTYDRSWMVKYDQNRPWKWYHSLHEYLGMQDEKPYDSGKLTGGYILASREGARSQDQMKYLKDAVTLETALKQHPDDQRDTFYLAQSYRDCEIAHLLYNAEKLYLKRTEQGGWDEERYIAFVEAGKCRQKRGKNDAKTLDYFEKAYEIKPNRLEAPHAIVKWYRDHNKFKNGYTFGKPLLNLPYPSSDRLFVNDEIHSWRLHDEVAVCAYWSGDYKASKEICEKILKTDIAEPNRSRVMTNLKFSNEKCK
jgi:tetratricopeptide (TPR) repeat protein